MRAGRITCGYGVLEGGRSKGRGHPPTNTTPRFYIRQVLRFAKGNVSTASCCPSGQKGKGAIELKGYNKLSPFKEDHMHICVKDSFAIDILMLTDLPKHFGRFPFHFLSLWQVSFPFPVKMQFSSHLNRTNPPTAKLLLTFVCRPCFGLSGSGQVITGN